MQHHAPPHLDVTLSGLCPSWPLHHPTRQVLVESTQPRISHAESSGVCLSHILTGAPLGSMTQITLTLV